MIKKLTIQNFRCFREINLSLKPGINLLIGENASGKTSILRACRYILASFFAGFNDENTRLIAPLQQDFRSYSVDGTQGPALPIFIQFDLVYGEEDFLNLSITKKSTSSSRLITSGLTSYKKFSAQLFSTFFPEDTGQVQALPLLAHFSTEGIHTSRKLTTKRFTNYVPKASFGYYECLEGDGFLPYWKKRILTLHERSKNLIEIDIVRDALLGVLGKDGCGFLHDMEVSRERRCLFFTFTDGREVEDVHLTDGYRHLINIIVDIAFRCALLNRGIYGRETCAKTQGCVLIDEIDLHLHPDLQMTILPSLQRVFPNLQFIATAHAPMVMTSVESNERDAVLYVDYESDTQTYKVSEMSTYGLDSSLILQACLDLPTRRKATQEELERLDLLIDEEDVEAAQNLIDELRARYHDGLPELAAAQTEIYLIQDLNAPD